MNELSLKLQESGMILKMYFIIKIIFSHKSAEKKEAASKKREEVLEEKLQVSNSTITTFNERIDYNTRESDVKNKLTRFVLLLICFYYTPIINLLSLSVEIETEKQNHAREIERLNSELEKPKEELQRVKEERDKLKAEVSDLKAQLGVSFLDIQRLRDDLLHSRLDPNAYLFVIPLLFQFICLFDD